PLLTDGGLFQPTLATCPRRLDLIGPTRPLHVGFDRRNSAYGIGHSPASVLGVIGAHANYEELPDRHITHNSQQSSQSGRNAFGSAWHERFAGLRLESVRPDSEFACRRKILVDRLSRLIGQLGPRGAPKVDKRQCLRRARPPSVVIELHVYGDYLSHIAFICESTQSLNFPIRE